MQAEDGLILRISPPSGQLAAAKARELADLASRFAHGKLTITSRAKLQLRGIAAADHAPILARLAEIGLLDRDADAAPARNIIVTPFWQPGDSTLELATTLAAALAHAPALPAKFGFAVDTGTAPVLGADPADIRLERAVDGTLLVRADGAHLGMPVQAADAVRRALHLADWFLASGGVKQARGRMRAHLAAGHKPPPDLAGTMASATALAAPKPGPGPAGMLAAFAFGDLPAETLDALAGLSSDMRLTPWRMLLLPGVELLPALSGVITDSAAPITRVFACNGAPGCGHALAETRILATALASHLPPSQRLHVSGCAKGCAHSGAADVTLCAMEDGFALIRKGNAAAIPEHVGLDPGQLLRHPGRIFGID